jgi:hypothetical protein
MAGGKVSWGHCHADNQTRAALHRYCCRCDYFYLELVASGMPRCSVFLSRDRNHAPASCVTVHLKTGCIVTISCLRTPQGKEEVSVHGAAGAAGGGAAGTVLTGTLAPCRCLCRPEQDADQAGNLCVSGVAEGIVK